MATTLRYLRGNLPHWMVADATYFVTIRISGTIPRSVLKDLEDERQRLVDARGSEDQLLSLARQHFMRIDRILDSSVDNGRRWLSEPDVARMTLDSMCWLESEERGWDIHAVCLMGTHAHIVMRNRGGRSEYLLDDLGQFKRHTAREANRILGRKGKFWSREDFDHWCRSPEKVLGAIRYTANNPVAAGMCVNWREWPWTKVHPDWIELAGL